MLKYKDFKKQCNSVLETSTELWKKNIAENKKLERGDKRDFENIGAGKFLLNVAMGASLERDIETIKRHRGKVDIMCCDKALGVLIDNNIIPNYCFLADARISFDWLKPYVEYTKDIKLISTIQANPEWTKAWKGKRYFYCNKDAVQSEKIFAPLFDDRVDIIPASSNVSNAMVVYMVRMDEWNKKNFTNYEKIFLIGYDYSFKPEGNYYAFNNPKPKRFYMTHRAVIDCFQDIVLTSENLIFSAKWLNMYVNTFKLPIINCSMTGLLEIPAMPLDAALSKINEHAFLKYKEIFEKLEVNLSEVRKIKKDYDNIRRQLWQ